jgi:hypothetical protein
MPYVMIDIESDGPIPGDYSMVCFGAIIVEPELNRSFYGKLKPISDKFIPEALAVSGFTREVGSRSRPLGRASRTACNPVGPARSSRWQVCSRMDPGHRRHF